MAAPDAVVILDASELAHAVRTMSHHDLRALSPSMLKRAHGLVRAGVRSAEALERRLAGELARRAIDEAKQARHQPRSTP